MPRQQRMSNFERASLSGMGAVLALYVLAHWLALPESWQAVLYGVLLLFLVSVVVVGLAQAFWWLLHTTWRGCSHPLTLTLVVVLPIAGTALYLWAAKIGGRWGTFDFAFGCLLVLAMAYRIAHSRERNFQER